MDRTLVCPCGLTCCDCLFHRKEIYEAARHLRNVLSSSQLDTFLRLIVQNEGWKGIAAHLGQSSSTIKQHFESLAEMPTFLHVLDGIIDLQCKTTCRESGGCSIGGVTRTCEALTCVEEKDLEGCWQCGDFRDCAKMSNRGLIFSIQPEDGPILYQAVPFVVGIYEFQVNRLSDGLLRDLGDYWSTMKPRPRPQTIPQLRTIPVGESIESHLEALPYEQVDELIKAHDRFAVAPCICRRHARMTGGGCDAPEESCLIFGEWADYYVRDGRGRSIDRSAVMEILTRADAANLVLQPSNSREIAVICCCCGCCCGVLRGLQSHPRLSEIVASSFIAKLEPAMCEGCWVCVERCQMQALAEDGDCVALNTDRCIGCGLCVSTCPSGALTLVRKPDSERAQPPITMDAAWRTMAQAMNTVG
jgi:electron transport complex protein RnfB